MRDNRQKRGGREGLRAAGDSGMVSRVHRADYVKEEQAGLFARIGAAFARAFRRVPGRLSTFQGSASAASPAALPFQLYALRYDRRQVITDCRQMYASDSRCRRAVNLFAREAVREGATISVATTGRGPTGQRARLARECARTVEALVNPGINSWARMLVVEGDLFLQFGVFEDRLVTIQRMPAAAMERLSDDTDDFPDPGVAFAQVDTLTNQEVATFPLWAIYHGRWNHIDGERYGESELIAARRTRRLLELSEDSQVRRRMVRAPLRRLWNIGSTEHPGEESDISNFKAQNGFVEGAREAFDPVEACRDVFGNGLVSAETLEGDPHVHEIRDLLHLQNVYASAGLPTPPPLYNLDAEAVNRDVLEDLRAEWLKETKTLTAEMKEAVRAAMDLALLLSGILPESVDYTIHFSESSIETPTEIVERVLKARQNITGGTRDPHPDPLLSRRRAVQLLGEFFDVEDVDAELAEIDRELSALEAQRQARLEALQQAPLVPGGAPAKTTPGKPLGSLGSGNGKAARNGALHTGE